MTNLGTTIEESAHKLDDKIERIFIMGGAIDVTGNVADFEGYYRFQGLFWFPPAFSVVKLKLIFRNFWSSSTT